MILTHREQYERHTERARMRNALDELESALLGLRCPGKISSQVELEILEIHRLLGEWIGEEEPA